jgi:Protein of unknown function (DUF664)
MADLTQIVARETKKTQRGRFEMPGNVAPVTNEREALVGFLGQQRYAVRLTAHGLTDEQARNCAPPSSLSVGGIIKHLSQVEQFWTRIVLEEVNAMASTEDHDAGFILGPDESLKGAIEAYEETCARTDEVAASIDDLGHLVPIPKEVPWFPKDVDNWSLRWVLLHLIEETARHAGHADMVREVVDGATAFALMAAAEGWPESPFIKPWKPES